ncbi:hypothetical protein [Streptomyces sp. NPDC001530]|uniref:hypothetical protein n=1 Tax=Streptomyces sp. NPDC001530 TaxID=3364582 RepID=UPI0036C7811A
MQRRIGRPRWTGWTRPGSLWASRASSSRAASSPPCPANGPDQVPRPPHRRSTGRRVTGALASPATLLLARHDAVGNLRLIARTTPLLTAQRRNLAQRLHPADPDHPWHGRRFSASWGTRGELEYHPVRPDLVAEFQADTAVDEARYRPVRFLRLRDDLAVQQVPPFGT